MPHDPSEILLIYRFAVQETFIIIINIYNSYVNFISGLFDE